MNTNKPTGVTEVIKKKRGRKPKSKPDDDGQHVIVPVGKRGRKPKNAPVACSFENKQITLPHDNLIIHLPIKSSDMSEMLNINYTKHSSRDLSPKPYEVENNFAYIKSNKLSNLDLPDKKHTSLFVNNNIKLLNTNIEFYNNQTRERLPDKTHQYCQWCCCKFDSSPISLPMSNINNKFYVTGCFCSFNCTMAYNFDKNYTNKWEYSALLHLLYKKIYNKYVKIIPSPPKELLKIFGGPLTIEEYRENLFTNDYTYSVIYPPIISIIPAVEEITNTNKMKDDLYIPLNMDLVDNTPLSITSKLTKEPIINNVQHTLSSYMDLSVKNT